MTQSEFDALPPWPDVEDDPEYNITRPHHLPPPSYNTCMDSHHTPLLLSTSGIQAEDEESQCGFWDIHGPSYNSILTAFPVSRGRSAKCETHEK